jgi:hypothetical protein
LKRGVTGTYEVSTLAGERVRAFIPAPLPPTPPLKFDSHLQQRLEAALLALPISRTSLMSRACARSIFANACAQKS